MYSVRHRCPTLVAATARGGVLKRNYATGKVMGASDDADEFIRAPSEKYDLIKDYTQLAGTAEFKKHPKIHIQQKQFSAKHTQEKEPWLFMLGAFPKSVHTLNKEAEEKKLSPPGSEFHGVWLKNEDVERAQQERFAKELITFRTNYEKPITDAFKEVDSQIEAEYTRQRFEKRKLTREAHKKAHKKAQPGSLLLKYMHEKEYWEKFVDALHVGDFASMPPRKEFMDMMEYESLKYDISQPDYDTDVIKIDYGQKSDWSISQHLALMIPDDEVQDLNIQTLFPPETQDQLYRAIRELEHVYGPVNHKIEAFHKNQALAVTLHEENYLLGKGKEIPPHVDMAFDPEHITEFDDVEDPDKISLEEIGYRLDKAYDNWKKRLLDPEVENRVKNYVRDMIGGGVWNRMTMGGNNRIMQFADSSIADQRIFLEDEDVVRILKGQLVDAGLARVVVKRKTPQQIAKLREEEELRARNAERVARGEIPETRKEEVKEAGGAGETGGVGTTQGGEGGEAMEGLVVPSGGDGRVIRQSKYFTETEQTVQYMEDGISRVVKKGPILTDDLHTYMQFEPVYVDKGTVVLPPKKKKEKIITKESEEDKFSQDVWALDDRKEEAATRLSVNKKAKYAQLYKDHLDYQRLDAEELQETIEEVEDELEAYREYQKMRAIWPQPQVGGHDLVGAELESFMRTQPWYPVNHLKYNNNVEFFTRTLPLAHELKRADKMRMRKVVMKVYIPPLELPRPVDQRLKLLLGPRYDQQDGTVKLTGSDRHTQKDNKAYLKLLFREILHEAWLADPNYIPTRAPAIEAPLAWKPSEASENVIKPVLFRLYGAPLQNSFQQKLALDRLNTTLNNPEGIIPRPSESRFSSFITPDARPHKIHDPAVVEANREKQRRDLEEKRQREPNYNHAPTEYYTASNPKVGETSETAKAKREEDEKRKLETKVPRDKSGNIIVSKEEREQHEKRRRAEASKFAKTQLKVREDLKKSAQEHRDEMEKRREVVKEALARGERPPLPKRAPRIHDAPSKQ